MMAGPSAEETLIVNKNDKPSLHLDIHNESHDIFYLYKNYKDHDSVLLTPKEKHCVIKQPH